MFRYFELKPTAVSQVKERAALNMLAHCSYELKLPPINLKWFVPKYDNSHLWEHRASNDIISFANPIRGFYRGTDKVSIWVRADQALDDTLNTVSHEALHALEFISRGFYYPDSEVFADDFADDMVNKYGYRCLSPIRSDIFLDWLVGKDFSDGRFEKAKDAVRTKASAPKKQPVEFQHITQEQWFIDASKRSDKAWNIWRRERSLNGAV